MQVKIFADLNYFHYINNMKIKVICQQCLEDFLADNRDVKRGRAKYCSRTCFSKSLIGKKRKTEKISNCICTNCNTSFHKSESKKKGSKSGLYFCSRICKDTAQRIGGIKEIQPDHYKDGLYNYREVAFRNFEKECNNCGYNEHIEILQVHHIDRNRKNNSPENLKILCPNCHMWNHYKNQDGIYNNLKGGTCTKVGEEHLQCF